MFWKGQKPRGIVTGKKGKGGGKDEEYEDDVESEEVEVEKG